MPLKALLFSAFALLLISCGSKKSGEELSSTQNHLQNSEEKTATSPWLGVSDSAFLALGNEYTRLTFDTLSKTLQEVIKTKGFVEAIQFCNVQALPLTESQIKDEWLSIKRTSLQVRNPQNEPEAIEKEALLAYAELFEGKGEMNARLLRENEDIVWYFRPIIMQPLCLNCHGNTEFQIQASTLQAIQEAYPKDHAIGYQAGDLRGMWSVKFLLKKHP